jgi:D-aminopeptidase
VIADIEGSSGCGRYADGAFLSPTWPAACREMTRDVDAAVRALLDAGAGPIRVVDFHRTGFNLLPEMIDSRAEVRQGYRTGPVPGLGDPGSAEAVLFLGMHAASGTPGFLAHTLTSRLAAVTVNGRPLPEVALFAGALGSRGLRPLLFSGGRIACNQARDWLPGIAAVPIAPADKDAPERWRTHLARNVVSAWMEGGRPPFRPAGPFRVTVRMRDGVSAAQTVAARWGFSRRGDRIRFEAADWAAMYRSLLRVAYLTPLADRLPNLGLALSNLRGRLGLAWVRRRLVRAEEDGFRVSSTLSREISG